jgi:predicted transcriptional regulator
MIRPVVITILLLSAVPLYAQDRQPNAAKLKADAQKVVSIIGSDKAKSRIYCEISDIDNRIDQEKDRNKAEALLQRMTDLEQQLGPEYVAFIEATKDVDPDSKDGQDIVSMFDELDEACPD